MAHGNVLKLEGEGITGHYRLLYSTWVTTKFTKAVITSQSITTMHHMHSNRGHISPRHLQCTKYNTNAMAISSTAHHVVSEMTPDNDLEYQIERQLRQQQQWPCQHQPTTSWMNSSTNSTPSRPHHLWMSIMDFPVPNPTFTDNTYVHPSHATLAQHQSTVNSRNAATGHHPQNFTDWTVESAHSVSSLTPESKPESGCQTGSMLVTGTWNCYFFYTWSYIIVIIHCVLLYHPPHSSLMWGDLYSQQK